jgi:hypothetical protein
VLEGGDGWINGGKSERSSDSGDLVPEDARERCGDGSAVAMVVRVAVGAVSAVSCKISSLARSV